MQIGRDDQALDCDAVVVGCEAPVAGLARVVAAAECRSPRPSVAGARVVQAHLWSVFEAPTPRHLADSRPALEASVYAISCLFP